MQEIELEESERAERNPPMSNTSKNQRPSDANGKKRTRKAPTNPQEADTSASTALVKAHTRDGDRSLR